MFTEPIIEYFKFKGKEESLFYIERFTIFHKEKYIYKTKPNEKPKNKIGYAGLHFLQCSLYKSRKLTESYINFLNSYNPYLIAIVVRTHMEVVGSVSYLYKKLISYYNGNTTIDIMEKALDRILNGKK